MHYVLSYIGGLLFFELSSGRGAMVEYFVHRDLWVGLASDGSYECELDVVAFHPTRRHLVHIEPSLEGDRIGLKLMTCRQAPVRMC